MIDTGDTAPDFTLTDQDGNPFTLSGHRGKVIIYFYPKAFTPGCTTEACDFRDNHQAFTDAGYEIVGISPDPVERLESFRAKHDLPFPVLSDEDHAVAAAYGAWGLKKNYGREYEGIIRSTFAIGEDRTVEHAWRNVRAKGHAARVLGSI
jgi:peroxiredoxin Q/BCP